MTEFDKVLEIAKDSLVESNQVGLIKTYVDAILVEKDSILTKEDIVGSFSVSCVRLEDFYEILCNKWISAHLEDELSYSGLCSSTFIDVCVFKKREENS